MVVADFPVLLKEWHPTRNRGRSPLKTPAGSNKPVWWRCQQGHEFRQSPNGRTNNHRNTHTAALCGLCYRGAHPRWTWAGILMRGRELITRHGFLPPASHLQQIGEGSVVQAVYSLGHTFADLRTELESFEKSSFVASRSGIRWRSHPEASFSNYLFVRGVQHNKGRKYPAAYGRATGKSYGYFDVLFYDRQGRAIDVEIWGDKPDGHGESKYSKTRARKEMFNKRRATFLGVHFRDCFDDTRLATILEPFIGRPRPYRFLKPYDRIIEASHWSNADELMRTCREIARQQPDGIFPTESWLRKRGRHRRRPGSAYNTVSVYIKLWLGGVRKLRALLGQEHASTIQWGREKVLKALKEWHAQYKKSPGAVRRDHDRGLRRLDSVENLRAGRLAAAIEKHAGGVIAAYEALGLSPSRRRPTKNRWVKRPSPRTT